MTSKLTRERIELIANFHRAMALPPSHAEIEELARMALAAMDSEPVAYIDKQWTLVYYVPPMSMGLKIGDKLYRHAQPAPEHPEVLPCSVLLEPGLRFGKGIKTSTMLADLARRAVHESDMAALSPEERAEFQARIEDFKALIAQPAPVVPDVMEPTIEAIKRILPTSNPDEYAACIGADMWNACRAAMLQELKKNAGTEAICRSDENVQVLHTKSPAQSDCCPAQSDCCPAQSDCCPAQNQGWIPVSERMPEKGQAVLVYRPKAHEGGDSDVRVAVYGRHNFEHGFGCYWEPSHWMPLPAAPQEVGDA
ncbi:DUF551 domain-containing protein [Klebsiella pneumoniae]|nr:DUF551 domain-containing protein [Klebsiella pneumoniae]